MELGPVTPAEIPVRESGSGRSAGMPAVALSQVRGSVSVFRTCEIIVLAYFSYAALLVLVWSHSNERKLVSLLAPALVCGLLALEARFSRPWSRVVRDWALPGLILAAYWQLEWLAGSSPLTRWQDTWIGWDRWVLDRAGLRAAIECCGWLFPSSLEAVYLSLYVIPLLCLGVLYRRLHRPEVNRFLTTLMLGTLGAYALLPHFPVLSPRIAFAGQDLPHYSGLWRSINVWLLDHCDISTGVFPSGHVAVAFSSAFGLLRAAPRRRWTCAAVFGAAVVVFLATIYSRYHYAADGLASIVVCVFAWRVSQGMDPHA